MTGYGRKTRRNLQKCRYTDEVTDLIARTIRKMPEYSKCRVDSMGPFGLGAECSVSVKDGDELLGFLTVTYGPYNEGFEYVDYNAKKKSTYPKGSIGDINGFNNVTYPLPSNMSEVIDLVFKEVTR